MMDAMDFRIVIFNTKAKKKKVHQLIEGQPLTFKGCSFLFPFLGLKPGPASS